jgi:hypothetical protein
MTDSTANEPLAAPESTSRNSVQLVSYGILGAIFVLYAIGWAIALIGGEVPSGDTLTTVMRAFGVGVAIAAGPLWFACVYLLTRHNRLPIKLLWQALGVIVLIPWPFIVGS